MVGWNPVCVEASSSSLGGTFMYSCTASSACAFAYYVTNIGNGSCHSPYACYWLFGQLTSISDAACHGPHSCRSLPNATLGENSCIEANACRGGPKTGVLVVESNSCIGVDSCYLNTGLTQIGRASCIGKMACARLTSVKGK
jgi:hypothetical protein